jgi:hypothetical protein
MKERVKEVKYVLSTAHGFLLNRYRRRKRISTSDIDSTYSDEDQAAQFRSALPLRRSQRTPKYVSNICNCFRCLLVILFPYFLLALSTNRNSVNPTAKNDQTENQENSSPPSRTSKMRYGEIEDVLQQLIGFTSRAKQKTKFREKRDHPSDDDALCSPFSSCDEEDEVNNLLAGV